jgi:hypothetical protein
MNLRECLDGDCHGGLTGFLGPMSSLINQGECKSSEVGNRLCTLDNEHQQRNRADCTLFAPPRRRYGSGESVAR